MTNGNTIDTRIDDLLELLQKEKSIKFDRAASELKVEPSVLEIWCNALSDSGLIEMDYTFGGIVLRAKDLTKKPDGDLGETAEKKPTGKEQKPKAKKRPKSRKRGKGLFHRAKPKRKPKGPKSRAGRKKRKRSRKRSGVIKFIKSIFKERKHKEKRKKSKKESRRRTKQLHLYNKGGRLMMRANPISRLVIMIRGRIGKSK